jgi:hypothetical protein
MAKFKYKPSFMTAKDYEPFAIYEELDVKTLKTLAAYKQSMIDKNRTEQVARKMDCIGVINNIILNKQNEHN